MRGSKYRSSEQRIAQSVVVDCATGCWTWKKVAPSGYARIKTVGKRSVMAHRFAYEALVGPIPAGLTIDHLCRNRGCVNPAHLEPVTMRENTLRGNTIPAAKVRQTHCIHGHPFDEKNTYIFRGCRHCKRCTADAQARRQQRIASEGQKP